MSATLRLPIGTQLPDLPGALCVGYRGGLPAGAWDAGASLTHRQQAIEVCQQCPELEPCGRWARTRRGGLVRGVIAGKARGGRDDEEND